MNGRMNNIKGNQYNQFITLLVTRQWKQCTITITFLEYVNKESFLSSNSKSIDYMLRCNIINNYIKMNSAIIGSIDLHNITNRESFSGLLWSNMPNRI